MIDVFFLNGLPVAVMGLGKSGRATAKALMASGAEVWAWDDNEDTRQAARQDDIPLVDLYQANLAEAVSLVLSPGIPDRHPEPHPVAAKAREAGVEIICDVELLGRAQRNASYIGITGTNGKSTTTALIGHILTLGGVETQVGGNLGTPALALDGLDQGGVYVLEMSSYQLERTLSITFDVAVLLNVTPDHLDRHGGLEGYLAAKKLIFHRQTKPRTAVVGVDDEPSRGIFEELKAAGEQTVVPISGQGRVPGGVYVENGILVDDGEGEAVQAMDLSDHGSLPGSHNWQNAAAAYAACKAFGAQPPVIAACIQSFDGLPHRQALVAEAGGVRFINDSKATNADAASKALACYEAIHWIAGGRAKEGGIASLEPYFPHIAKAYLIGESAEAFARTLEGKVDYEICGDLETAVVEASASAAAGRDERPVVLLSPAAASFDQFKNFEERGETFSAIARREADALEGAAPAGGAINEGSFEG